MAQMIPDTLPRRASKGEERVYQALQRLPDSYLVYYEPVVSHRYPDFIVLAPDLGVLVLEVKGWRPGDLLGGDSNQLTVKEHGGGQMVEKHPLRQARDYQHRLQDLCRRSREASSLLLHAAGDHAGKFLFPFGHCAVLSNIEERQLREHTLGDLTPLFPAERVLHRNRLLTWESMTGEQLQAELRTLFNPVWTFTPLTERQMDLLRSIVHPEITVREEQPAVDLAVLDLRQGAHARSIGNGHRIIYGVAGSGKTVLLLARVKLLASQTEEPDARFLVLCYNVSLAAYLRGALSNLPSVSVHHFDGWCKVAGIYRRRAEDGAESDASLGARLLQSLQDGSSESRRYDAVFVDEAQDFDPSWFRCVLEAMKEPEEGDLVIVGDRNQGIRGAKALRWSDLGINAQGRTISKKFDLDQNYRNSKEILELAAVFAGEHGEGDDEDSFGVVAVDPEKGIRPTGWLPVLHRSPSRKAETDAVVECVRALLQPGEGSFFRVDAPLQPHEIGILYPRLPRWRDGQSPEEQAFEHLQQQLQTLAPVVWMRRDGSVDLRGEYHKPGIKLLTIHSAKGLQFRAVLLLWADMLPNPRAEEPLAESRLMYVALTRPEDYLFVSHSGASAFVDTIRTSGKVRVM